jgi:spermidine synthase
LFQKPFYEHLKEGLRDGGIACTQAECQWLHLELIKNLVTFSRTVFKSAEYAFASVPTYPAGQIGFLLGSMGDSCNEPKRTPDFPLRYYNPSVHRAAFALPQFVSVALEKQQ